LTDSESDANRTGQGLSNEAALHIRNSMLSFVNKEAYDDALSSDVPKSDDGLDIERETYQKIIRQSPAFAWLLGSVQSAMESVPANPDIMSVIRTQLLQSLPSRHHISRKNKPQTYTLDLELDWDPIHFLKAQGCGAQSTDVIQHVITLTGSESNAQALTTKQYLSARWPENGPLILQLVCAVMVSDNFRSTGMTIPMVYFNSADSI
jgi:hypothetical protein